MMLNAGKHVLCEKPLGMNVKETHEMVALARTQKLFLMEAIWSRCLPAYDKVLELLEKGNFFRMIEARNILIEFST